MREDGEEKNVESWEVRNQVFSVLPELVGEEWAEQAWVAVEKVCSDYGKRES